MDRSMATRARVEPGRTASSARVVPVAVMLGLLAACAPAAGSPAGPVTSAPPGSSAADPASSSSARPAPSADLGAGSPVTSPGVAVAGSGNSSAVIDGVVSAAGVRQWIECRGTGPVTVVVIPGLNASAAAWRGVLPELQASSRVCVYDRPGIGLSPPRANSTQIVDAGLYAVELRALLDAVGEPGPYVLLGHSFGGLIARAFLARYPRTVRAILLAESDTPGDPTTGRYWFEANHDVDMAASSAAADGGPRMGRMPLLVLSASNPERDHLGGPTYGQPAWMIALWRREQAADVLLSTDAIQVTAHSGHVLQADDPAAVIEAVRTLLTSVESSTQLGCTPVWVAVGATCR
jgi:pimeloyl-ACP methyl ester carboxylesterase